MKYYSAIKKHEIMPSATVRMDLKIIILNKISHTETDIYVAYMYNLKK